MKKLSKIVIIVVFTAVVAFISFWTYIHFYGGIADRERYNVKVDNGDKFKVVYTLYNFPDESYDIRLYGKNKEFIHLFGGDGSGNKYIEIDFLCSNGNLDYYKVLHENHQNIHEKLFVYNSKEKMVFDGCEKHIESFPDGIIMFNDTESDIFELFIPAAKHQILNDNNGDYIGAYGERLIVDGNKEILEKIKFLVENPDVIKYDICSKEEIVSRCQELLQKYGGEQ